MALIIADRVKETSTSVGTGTFTLDGAQTGFVSFSDRCNVADTCYYCIQNMALGEWEVGLGTYSALNTLTRTTVLASSNGGSAVVFSAGTKDVFLTSAAAWLRDPQVNSVTTPTIKPLADSTTAVQITKADGATAIVNVDTTNSRIGVNITPTSTFEIFNIINGGVQTVTSEWPSSSAGNILAFYTSYGDNPRFVFRRANGTVALPTALASGNALMQLVTRGYDGSTSWSTQNAGQLLFAAEEAFTSTAHGTRFSIHTTPNGSVLPAERVRIDNAGNVGINLTAPLEKLSVVGNLNLPKTSGYGIKVDTAAPTFPWQDLFGHLRPDTGGANSPTLAAVRGGLTREFFYSVNDKMDMDFHIPHDYVPGTDIYIHIHWGHNGTAISGNFVVDITHTYAKGHNQAIFPAEKTVNITYATVDIATTPQYIHRVDEVQLSSAGGSATLMDNALLEPDGVIMVNMTVTGIPTITGGSTNEPFICFADIHYQSTSIGTKAKAPDFYT